VKLEELRKKTNEQSKLEKTKTKAVEQKVRWAVSLSITAVWKVLVVNGGKDFWKRNVFSQKRKREGVKVVRMMVSWY